MEGWITIAITITITDTSTSITGNELHNDWDFNWDMP